MAKPKKRKKLLIFALLALVLAGLTTAAILKKREVVITIQTEKVARRDLIELVEANGKIQPVVQVKISPEVSGEIIALPVKEGQSVKKGDLILKIKPDAYTATRNQAEAGYKSSIAGRTTAAANLDRAQAEFERNRELFERKLISESAFLEIRTTRDVSQAQLTNSIHQVAVAKAQLDQADEALAKTTIVSPITGTISKLDSELGERVVGTATMAGTEVMTIANLNEMEARVDIGETDVVLIEPGQHARLEVDAFKDRKFNGIVTEIGNSAKGTSSMASSSSQEATKFEVRIRLTEKEIFRPGMSVTAEIETRARTNVLTVPLASVVSRLPKGKDKDKDKDKSKPADLQTNKVASVSPATNSLSEKKARESARQITVVFLADGERAKQVPVKIGISDKDYYEILEGLTDGQEIVSGGFRALKDLEDGKKVQKGTPGTDNKTDAEKKD